MPMITNYGIEFDNEIVYDNLKRIGGQIFKLLPAHEEGKDWKKPLDTLIIELLGMASLFPDKKNLLALVSKMEGLKNSDPEFTLYRRTIFECCTLVNKLQEAVNG